MTIGAVACDLSRTRSFRTEYGIAESLSKMSAPASQGIEPARPRPMPNNGKPGAREPGTSIASAYKAGWKGSGSLGTLIENTVVIVRLLILSATPRRTFMRPSSPRAASVRGLCHGFCAKEAFAVLLSSQSGTHLAEASVLRCMRAGKHSIGLAVPFRISTCVRPNVTGLRAAAYRPT